jgi:hypothetical protein
MSHAAKRLFDEAMTLPPAERKGLALRLLHTVENLEEARTPQGATLSWDSLRAAIGVVHGAPADAVEDEKRLYDG